MERLNALFLTIAVLLLVAGIGMAVKGTVIPSDTSVGSAQYQQYKAAENPDDPCATPSGYTDEDWRTHMSHHPDQYPGCL